MTLVRDSTPTDFPHRRFVMLSHFNEEDRPLARFNTGVRDAPRYGTWTARTEPPTPFDSADTKGRGNLTLLGSARCLSTVGGRRTVVRMGHSTCSPSARRVDRCARMLHALKHVAVEGGSISGRCLEIMSAA